MKYEELATEKGIILIRTEEFSNCFFALSDYSKISGFTIIDDLQKSCMAIAGSYSRSIFVENCNFIGENNDYSNMISCCGKKLAARSFYKSLNPKHKDGLTPMCKKCCVKQSLDNTGDNVDLERFKNTLHFNDKPYRTELYRAAILQAEKKYSEDGTAKLREIKQSAPIQAHC